MSSFFRRCRKFFGKNVSASPFPRKNCPVRLWLWSWTIDKTTNWLVDFFAKHRLASSVAENAVNPYVFKRFVQGNTTAPFINCTNVVRMINGDSSLLLYRKPGLLQCSRPIISLGVWDRGLVTRLVSDLPLVINSQVIGCEDRLRNDLYCLGRGVKLYSIQSDRPRSWSWSWSCSIGLGFILLVLLPTSWCARQALCDMIMLKCNKHLYFFVH